MDYVRYLIMRHGLTVPEMSRYLGVPLGTVRRWLAGTSHPTASAHRLVDVMSVILIRAPAMHAALIADCRVPRKRSGPKKNSTYVRWKKGRADKS